MQKATLKKYKLPVDEYVYRKVVVAKKTFL